MYADPSLIRKHPIKLSFNDLERDLIAAWVNYHGGETAPFLRELILEQARLDLGLEAQASDNPQLSLLRAG